MAERKKLPTGTSPKGVAVFPHLNKPDDKFDKVVFKVNLRMSADDGVSLVERIDNMMAGLASGAEDVCGLLSEDEQKRRAVAQKAKKLKAYDLPYGPQTDKEGNVDESQVVFKFKKNGTYKDKKTGDVLPARGPALFDAKGASTNVEVRGGSEIKVSYQMMPWVNAKSEYGVKLGLNAVQVISLQSSGGGSAGDFGFGEEDGFSDESSLAAPSNADGESPGTHQESDDGDF